jgi:hypothetical protein
MSKFCVFIAAAAAMIALTGCSTHPIPDDVTRISTFDIAEQIRCEAKRAVDAYPYRYTTAALAYEFTFEITEANSESGDLTAVIPFTGGGRFSILAGAGSNRERTTKRNFKLSDTFEQLKRMDCRREILERNWAYPIAGDIGVYEVVRTFLRLQKANNPKAGDVFTFADTLKFTTAFNGGIQPKLVLNPVTDRLRVVEANANLSARRSDVHQVVLTMAGGPERDTRMPVGASLAVVGRAPVLLGAAASPSSLVSTTVLQAVVSPRDRALLELDRQRILTLQERTPNLLIGP